MSFFIYLHYIQRTLFPIKTGIEESQVVTYFIGARLYYLPVADNGIKPILVTEKTKLGEQFWPRILTINTRLASGSFTRGEYLN